MPPRLTSLVLAVFLVLPAALAASQTQAIRDRAMPPYKAGLIFMQSEQWEEAKQSFRTAIDTDATFEMAHYMLGRVHLAQKQFRDAIAALSRARDLYRSVAGRAFSDMNDQQLSRRDRIAEIDEAIRELQMKPQTNRVQEQLRQLNDSKRQVEDAKQRAGNVSLKITVPAHVTLSLGSAYFRLNDLTEAEKAYKESLDADSKQGETHNNLAVVYLMTGRYREAEAAVRAAEQAGYRVSPALKDNVKQKSSGR